MPSGIPRDFGFAPMIPIPFDMKAAAFPASAALGALDSPSTLYVATPTFVSSAITGTPQNGEVLTASTQPIAVSYQWRKNSAIIAGQTGQTITLDRVTMGLGGGNRISCEISLTNSAGTALAKPFVFFDGGELPALLALVSGRSSSGLWDFRRATDTGVWTASNLGGGLGSRTQATGGLKPGRSITDGAIFPRLIRATRPTGNSS